MQQPNNAESLLLLGTPCANQTCNSQAMLKACCCSTHLVQTKIDHCKQQPSTDCEVSLKGESSSAG
eukprot:1161997-Pelagomonas_calceolata.AAC.13